MSHAPLANAELAVMELLWIQDRLTSRAIRERLYPEATKAQHGTVQKLLQRLEEKGYIHRDRTLAVHLFSAAVSREAYAGGQLESLADKLTGGSLAPLLTHLIEERRLPADELRRLREILEDAGDDDAEGGRR
ncbi:MAG: BlaI/MecI/CopY family transcriptional regulator [Planctomycetota bacterium]